MSEKRPGSGLWRILTAAVIASGVLGSAQAQSLCGTYATIPGSIVHYEYMAPGTNVAILPLVAQLTFSCDNPTTLLQARLDSPIIGVDEQGNIIFPIGGQFPMTVSGQSSNGRQFWGDLLGTPYLFEWEFDLTPGGALLWNGDVYWSGGRYEHTTITDVELTPVPEPSGLVFMFLALPLGTWRVRHANKKCVVGK